MQNTTGLFLKCNFEYTRQNYRKAIKLLSNSCQKNDADENLAALCVACHSKKTRANTLKEHAAFCEEYTKRASEIEENIFKNLAFVPKRSKYFPINEGRE